MLWPSTLTIEQLADVIYAPLSQVRRWVRAGVLRPADRDGARYVYSRDEAVLGAVILVLQQALGEKSKAPLAVAAELRPRLQGWLRWEPPHFPGPISMKVTAGQLAIEAALGEDELRAICQRLDGLARQVEKRRYERRLNGLN